MKFKCFSQIGHNLRRKTTCPSPETVSSLSAYPSSEHLFLLQITRLLSRDEYKTFWIQSKLVNDNLWDYLDAQYWFRQSHVDHRQADGIHWNAKAHRWLTNLILSHIGEAWGIGLPTFVSFDSQKTQKMSNEAFYVIPPDIETKVKRKDVSF